MRNLKKFLALVLAMVMALSLMVTANAASDNVTYPDSDSVTEEFQEAVTVLGGMGIMTGDNGNFYPERTIMRSEMAAVLYRLMTGDTRQLKNQLYADIAVERFNDVTADAWFAPYIGWCYDAGLMVGSNGYVRPWDPVTGYETLVMVLRAMGYGKNHEYTGAGWYINASSDGTLVGLLADVNNTHYANTLSRNSTREVVASIVFQGAQLPTVRYELGYYNKYVGVALGTGNNKLNPSLGEINFGLTKQTGIVVGNQATGEDWTLVGVVAKGIWDAAGTLTDVELSQTGSYVYTTTASGLDGTTIAKSTGNVTVQFNFGTGLEYFGHKVNTWYDSRTPVGTQDFNGTDGGRTTLRYNRTYAVIDKANKVATVWANNTTDNAPVANKTSIYTAAANAGFNPQWGTPGWESDRFSQMGANADNAVVQSKIGTYTIISNNGDLIPDVVISLNQEVATINQVNTTVKDGEYIYLDSGNSRFGGKVGIAAGTEYGGKLLDVLLAPGSEKTLSTLVTANEIVGTTPIVNGANVIGLAANDTTDRDIKTDSTAITIDAKFCRYETTKLEPAFTGTVSTYVLSDVPTNTATKHVVSVTLTDGKTYDLSGITGSDVNDASPYDWNFDGYCHMVNGLTVLTGNTTSAGTTYTFYTDVVGRIIGVKSTNDYEFLYTTFADYDLGGLGTGTSGYYVYGVNWDGEIVKDKKIVSITEPTEDSGTGNTDEFDDNTPNDPRTYPNASPESLAVGYNNLPVTLRDQGHGTSGVVGNEIRSGVNTRFVVNGAGDMDWYNVGGNYGTRFMGWWDASLGVPAASYTWTITSGDARNGFVRVYNNNQVNHTAPAAATDNTDYLLTESTKFIVVTGSGTADLSVKIYTGLTELLDGGTSAEITYDFTNSGDNVYFLTSAQRYGNTNTVDNGTIDTVIMSDTNLTQYNMQSLFFSKPGNTATGVKLAGDPGIYGTINQYEMYNKGVKGYYWISDTRSTAAGGGNNANGTATKGDFFRLTPIGEVNGQTIYKADCVVAANTNYDESTRPMNSTGSNVNQQYDYIVVNDLSTAAIGNVSGANTVMKVTGATVTQVYGDNQSAVDTAFPAGLNITDLLTLNHAVAMGKAGDSGNLYTIQVAIVYDGINVTDIYVTNITP